MFGNVLDHNVVCCNTTPSGGKEFHYIHFFCHDTYVWLSIYLGHKDSVTCTGFSHDGRYIATGDMSGLVQVWKVVTGECIWTYECTDLEVGRDGLIYTTV